MSLGKETILLIDDDMDVLQAYQTLLELEDYHIIATSDPEEALALINLDWFGVVISDIYMPKMSGWSLLEKVRAKDKDVPVILITGHGDVPMAIEAVKSILFYRKTCCSPEFIKSNCRSNTFEKRTIIKQGTASSGARNELYWKE